MKKTTGLQALKRARKVQMRKEQVKADESRERQIRADKDRCGMRDAKRAKKNRERQRKAEKGR